MSYTKEQMRVYMHNRYLKRRRDAVSVLGGECVACGTTQDLEFHHTNPATKLFRIARGWSFSEQRFWNEVHKCQLMCVSCHADFHADVD